MKPQAALSSCHPHPRPLPARGRGARARRGRWREWLLMLVAAARRARLQGVAMGGFSPSRHHSVVPSHVLRMRRFVANPLVDRAPCAPPIATRGARGMTRGTWRRLLQALVVATFAVGVGGAAAARALAQTRAAPSPVKPSPCRTGSRARPALKAPERAGRSSTSRRSPTRARAAPPASPSSTSRMMAAGAATARAGVLWRGHTPTAAGRCCSCRRASTCAGRA